MLLAVDTKAIAQEHAGAHFLEEDYSDSCLSRYHTRRAKNNKKT